MRGPATDDANTLRLQSDRLGVHTVLCPEGLIAVGLALGGVSGEVAGFQAARARCKRHLWELPEPLSIPSLPSWELAP